MRTRWLALIPLLAACGDSTGPSDGWTHEGTIESGFHMVADVDQYATIACQIDGRNATVYTGAGGGNSPHCLKLYHTVTVDTLVTPVYTLYIANGEIGKRYRASIR